MNLRQSAINQFLKCPKSYDLGYIQNLQSDSTDKVKYGIWVHEQIETALNGEEYSILAEPFIQAVKKQIGNKTIEGVEQKFTAEIGGYTFTGTADLVLEDAVIDYKTTGSPDYYKNQISWQAILYSHVFNKPFKYYLLCVDDVRVCPECSEKITTSRKTCSSCRANIEHVEKKPTFSHLIEYPVNISPRHLLMRVEQLIHIATTMDYYEQAGHFPPSFNSCHQCFFKEFCDEYSGY